MSYQVKCDVPVFNSERNPFVCRREPFTPDGQGLFRCIETVLFEGTAVKLERAARYGLAQITTEAYPSKKSIYVPFRALKEGTGEPRPSLFKAEVVRHRLQMQEGIKYFWGGNTREGVPEMLQWYRHLKDIAFPEGDPEDALCQGFDCSGLLYFAARGLTPRNTSDLIAFGEEVPYHPLMTLEEVQELLRPLDLVVWKGHVVVVLSPTEIIESRPGHGVVISELKKRFQQLQELAVQAGQELHIRRWHPEMLRLPPVAEEASL